MILNAGDIVEFLGYCDQVGQEIGAFQPGQTLVVLWVYDEYLGHNPAEEPEYQAYHVSTLDGKVRGDVWRYEVRLVREL